MSRGRDGKPSQSTCNKCRSASQYACKLRNPKRGLLNWARRRVKESGLPYNLTVDDFEIPEFCPVLGIPLKVGKGKLHDFSPTLDRLVPELGYVKGNVEVISYKANRMRNNATLDELKLLVRWLENKDNTEGRPEQSGTRND